jgi:probable rRNA maturation factor
MAMLNIENLTTININNQLLETISNFLTPKDVDMTLCDNPTIQRLNFEFRGEDRATDVLSFPINLEFPNTPLGSIVISADKVLEGSREFGHGIDEELALLFIHGVLHLLGYDHEVDGGEMRSREQELIAKFNLPESLIVRVEEK